MATYRAEITAVVTGGPYSYLIYKDNVGQKAVDAIATISAALDGVKADIGGMLGSEVISKIVMNVVSG